MCTWLPLRKQARRCFGRKPRRILGVQCATQRNASPLRARACVRACEGGVGCPASGRSARLFWCVRVYLWRGWSCDGEWGGRDPRGSVFRCCGCVRKQWRPTWTEPRFGDGGACAARAQVRRDDDGVGRAPRAHSGMSGFLFFLFFCLFPRDRRKGLIQSPASSAESKRAETGNSEEKFCALA